MCQFLQVLRLAQNVFKTIKKNEINKGLIRYSEKITFIEKYNLTRKKGKIGEVF